MAEAKLCAVDGCGKTSVCRGWCAAHYTRWKRHGDPVVKKTGGTVRGVCSEDGCGKPHKARGLCSTHFARWTRHGTAKALWTPFGEPEAWLRSHVHHTGDDCLIWPFARRFGRGVVLLNGKTRNASRIMCEWAHGPAPLPDLDALHSCGKGHEGCVNPCHLRWGTHTENMADKVPHGTHNRGERHPASRLTEAEVRHIRALRGRAERSAVAAMFGIHPARVGAIQRRKAWGWLI